MFCAKTYEWIKSPETTQGVFIVKGLNPRVQNAERVEIRFMKIKLMVEVRYFFKYSIKRFFESRGIR